MGKWLVGLVLVLAGCSNTLETGYEYHPLNMSLSQRKSLYADPFSPAAQEAKEDNNSSGPTGGGPTRPGQTY